MHLNLKKVLHVYIQFQQDLKNDIASVKNENRSFIV